MYRYQKLKSLLLLLLVAVTAKAQLSNGKVYNFVNAGKGTSMSVNAMGGVSVTSTDQSNYSQLWYAASDGSGFTLRNLANGHYLKSPNATSNAWTMVATKEANCIFSATSVGDNYAIRVTNNSGGYNYMHADGSGNIVCWESSNTNSQWTMDVVSIDAATLSANWNRLTDIDNQMGNTSNYQTNLDNFFSDKACTTLKKSFASESAVTSDADYQALPTTLQQMVLKVYKDSWAEDNYDGSKSAWGADYAKKYRVQLYEPYNEPANASTALSLNQHTNLNNPTGIFANSQELLYVMVEGEIKDGASLYLASYTGNGKPGGYNQGVALQQGLNIVPSYVVGNNYCINYVVETFDTSNGKRGHEAKKRSLKNYAPLKIHIEGGYINGYWNKVGDALYTPDNNSNWDYLEKRATQTSVTILGEYMTLQFPLNDADTEGNKGLGYYLNDRVKVEDVINSWDNVMMWERFLLGVAPEAATTTNEKNVKSPYSERDYVVEYTGNDQDFPAGYGDYYNVHGLAFGVGGNAYMYGSGDHSGYHYNTMNGVIEAMPTNAGSHWGPAHEIGHQHQNLINMRGETEVSNNLFSNVVLWYFGETTSRVNGTEGSLENILKNFNSESGHYLNNNIWGMTQMYYKLFLYYHVLGHNPKFYPRLFEMLRQDPQVDNRASNVDGSKAQLHLYKKACMAAGEDLTEFFRAHGFMKPLDGFSLDDYGVSTYTMTQEQIDAAIAEVKALNYEENISVLFINDATGETIKSHKGDDLTLYGETTVCAELGGYASYSNSTTPDYNYTISGNTVTMEGEGGTGFAIFNEKGEIIAFSNKKTFQISDDCVKAIASGKAIVKTVNADNTAVEAVNILDTDDANAKYLMLGELLESAKAILDIRDETGKKVGFYRTASLTKLDDAYTTAKTVYDANTVASYVAVYNTLFQEYANVMNDDYARIGIVESNAYRLTNKAYSDRSMAVYTAEGEDKNEMFGLTTDANADAQKWYFEPSTTEGRYYLKNKATNLYPAGVSSGAVLKADKEASTKGEKNGAAPYELRDMGGGVWALINGPALHCSESQSNNIVGWNADADASQWYITAVEIDNNAEELHKLQGLISQTEALIDEVGETKKIKLQGTDAEADYYLYCNALFKALNNADTSPNTEKLLDGDPKTHIHTDYRTTSEYVADDDLDHYLRIDMGFGNAISNFQFTYTTRNAGGTSSHPKKIVIEGCNDLDTEEFTHIITLPREGDSSLPGANTNNDGRGVYTSPVITTPNSTPYRYIRFMVTETQGNNVKSLGGHPYFYMAEFNLLVNSEVKVDGEYSSEITVEELTDAFNSLLSAKEVVENTDAEQYDDACNDLLGYYNALLTDKNKVETSNLTNLKSQLSTLIAETTELIGECGKVTVIPGSLSGKVPLQTTEANNDFYLWTNAQSTQEVTNNEPNRGYLVNLLDGINTTFFHSDYSGANSTDKLDHHITANLGMSNKTSMFSFKYVTRHDAETNYPKTIKVLGSENGTYYEEIEEFTGLPSGNTKTYKSRTISADKEYSYLRFMVTATNNNNLKSGHPIFHMAEFELDIIGTPESYTAELGAGAGDADTDLLIETYRKNAEAQGVYTHATTEIQVEAAIAKLTAAKNALEEAKYAAQDYTVRVVGGNGQGGVNFGGFDYTHEKNFSAPASLQVGDLTAIKLDGYTVNNVELNGTTITVTYNKVYSVKVVGVEPANGGVKLGETTYAGGATFEMLESVFNIADFNVIDLQGYEENKVFEGATITITYNKVYTIQVTGGRDNGGIAYDGTTYRDGDTFSMLKISFDKSKLSPIKLDGYEVKEEIMVDDATGIISVVYSAIPLVESEKYYTLECRSGVAHSTVRFIRDNGTKINGSSSEGSLFQFEAANDDNGYYIKSYVTGKYINHADGAVYASEVKATIWTMDKPSHTPEARTLTVVDNNLYLNNNGSDCTDGTCTNLQSLSHDGGAPGSGNACSLWTLVESVSDKSQLSGLIENTLVLMQECQSFENSAHVTEQLLINTSNAIGTAQEQLDKELTIIEYNVAVTALQAAYDKLDAAKANAIAEANERAELNGQLLALIAETEDLIATCYENEQLKYINSEFVTEDDIAEIEAAIETAQAKCETTGTTESEYNASLETLGQIKANFATAIENAKNEAAARDEKRTELNALIDAANELITLCGTTPGDATESLINEVSAAVTSAREVASNMGSTVEQLANAATALEDKYNVLNDAHKSTAKADLRALIAQTEALIAECGTVEYGVHDVPTSIDLQSTDSNADYWISSNADQNTGGGTNDGGGIAALVDNNTVTYFHTRWGGTEVNEPHYIQVDMGEDVINKFKFSYIARNNSPAPTIIEIYGWNEDEEPTLITTVTKDWPDYNDNGTYDSELITPTKAYRYLCFTITKSNGPGNEQYGGQYFFGMKEFDLFSVAEETSYYVESIISYGNITEEQLINIAKARDDAEALAEESYDKVALVEATANLQALYNALQTSHNDYSYLPVTLTTNMLNPVLYTLGSGRGKDKVLQYDPAANHMLSIADASENSPAKQLFYFTKGSVKGQVFIHPFAAGENVLASNDVTDGSAKVKVMPKDSEGYMQEWTLPVQNAANSVYNIKPITGGTYFSNHGGDGYKMGFYNNTGDDGSRFTFIQTTIEGSSAYHSLKVYYDEALEDLSNKNPGHYGATLEFEEAYAVAENLLAGSADYVTYLKAYRSLRAANESLVIIVPEAGKFYTIKNGDYYITGNTTSGGRIELSTTNDANTIYYYDGTHLLSYSTGLYIGLNAKDWTFEAVGSNDISRVEFSMSTTTPGAFNIYCGTRWLHRTNAYVDRCSDNIHGTEHSWIIEEVTSLPVSVSAKLGFASFYAPVAVTMPEGMTAYVVTGVNGDKAPISVLAEEGEIIPANTGVLLYAEGGDYTLDIADAVRANEVGVNLLNGTIDDQYIEYGNATHYMLGYKNEIAGLYVVAKNLTETGVKDAENGTHFKNNGFKSYLTVSGENQVSALRLYRGATTEIDNPEAINNSEFIYDLAGRRVLNPAKGVYIVNGKKVIK